MPMITDYIVLAAVLYFFYAGWRKGFLKTLLSPLSLIIACLFGYKYYQINHNIPVALGICLIGPFLFYLVFALLLKFWNSTVDEKKPPSIFSSTFAGLFSILWGCSYLVMLLFFFAVAPINDPYFKKAQNDVLDSKSYWVVKALIGDKLPGQSVDIKKVAEVLQDEEKFEKLQNTKEFMALQEDDTLINIFEDEKLNDQIRNKEYSKIIANPKMQELFKNKELMEKLLALSHKISEDPEEVEAILENDLGTEDETVPKVIEIPPAE